MKVLQNGKEVEGAVVAYDSNGGAQHVTIDGVNYDASAFEFVDDEAKKNTKPASTKTKATKPAAKKKGIRSRLSGVFSTEDVKRK